MSDTEPDLDHLTSGKKKQRTYTMTQCAKAGGLLPNADGIYPLPSNGFLFDVSNDILRPGTYLTSFEFYPRSRGVDVENQRGELEYVNPKLLPSCKCGYKMKMGTLQPFSDEPRLPNFRFGDHIRIVKCAQWKVVRLGVTSSSDSPFSSPSARPSTFGGWRSPKSPTSPSTPVDFMSKNKKDLACSTKMFIDAPQWKLLPHSTNLYLEWDPVAEKSRPIVTSYHGAGISPQYKAWLAHADRCITAIAAGRKALEDGTATTSTRKPSPKKKAKKPSSLTNPDTSSDEEDQMPNLMLTKIAAGRKAASTSTRKPSPKKPSSLTNPDTSSDEEDDMPKTTRLPSYEEDDMPKAADFVDLTGETDEEFEF